VDQVSGQAKARGEKSWILAGMFRSRCRPMFPVMVRRLEFSVIRRGMVLPAR